jgi:hypothetical protein
MSAHNGKKGSYFKLRYLFRYICWGDLFCLPTMTLCFLLKMSVGPDVLSEDVLLPLCVQFGQLMSRLSLREILIPTEKNRRYKSRIICCHWRQTAQAPSRKARFIAVIKEYIYNYVHMASNCVKCSCAKNLQQQISSIQLVP